MKNLIFLALGLFLILSACREDSIDTDITTDPPIPNVFVETDIDGIVTDINGNPIEDVTVVAGNSSGFTDERGVFSISGLQNRDHTLIRVEKDGYFTAFPVITTQNDSRQSIEVILYERNVAGTLTASTGGEVSLVTGGSIEFPPNAFIDTDGNLYNGTVNVYAYFIDPTSPDLNAIMPGNLTAIDNDGQLQGLSSFGMINVELESASGEKLDLNTNATLRMPIPADLQATAPTSMPMWFFDESDGFWKEEGAATRNGNIYIGQVAHFTFWNCDVPFDLIELTGRIQADGVAAEGVRVCVTRNNTTGTTRCTRTNNRGVFLGKVPADESLLLEVLDPCGTVMDSQQIGPYADDTDIGLIGFSSNSDFVDISGTLVDCDMNPVTNGYAYIRTDNDIVTTAHVDANGNFFVMINVCDATEVSILPFDVENLQQGDLSTYPVSSEINTGTIAACGTQILEAFEIQTPTLNYLIPDCKMTLQTDSSGVGNTIQITSIDDQGSGNQMVYDFYIVDWNNDPSNPQWGVAFSQQIIGDPDPVLTLFFDEVELIQFSDVPGEYTIFEFNNCGVVEGQNGQGPVHTGLVRLTALVQ